MSYRIPPPLVIISLSAARDLDIVQLDVTTAFLHGVIDEVLYIAQPEGYAVPGRSEEVRDAHYSESLRVC